MKIAILDATAANPGDLSWERFEEIGEVSCYDITPPDKLIERAKDCEILLTNKTCFTERDFEQLPKLRYIGVLATGYNVVDLKAAAARGVTVTNVPEYATFATAQMTVALLLELTNKVGIHSRSVAEGDWTRSPSFCYTLSPLTELYGKTCVITGSGKIGRRVGLILDSLGMKVIFVPHKASDNILIEGRSFPCMELKDALGAADVLTFHCPLTEETEGLLGRENIKLLKDNVLIINTARGPIADEAAVRDALRSGKIGGYAADVVTAEPMDPQSPLLEAMKEGLNIKITPHIAWAPKETRARLIDAAFENLRSFLEGDPVNCVTP